MPGGVELHRRVPDPARRVRLKIVVRDRRQHRRRARGGLRAAAVHPRVPQQPWGGAAGVARDLAARRPRARAAGRWRSSRSRCTRSSRCKKQRDARRRSRSPRRRRSDRRAEPRRGGAVIETPDDRLGGPLPAHRAARRRARRARRRPRPPALGPRGRSCRSWPSRSFGAAIGLCIWQWGERHGPHGGRAAPRRAHAHPHDDLLRRGHRGDAAGLAARRAARGGARRVLLPAAQRDRRHVRARRGDEPRHAVPRPRAAVDPALRAVRDRDAARGLAGVGPEVPHRRLRRLGDPALRPGVPLRRDGLHRLHRDRDARSRGPVADDALLLGGIALAMVGLAFKASVAPFHQWTPDVYEGAPTPVTAFMAVATKAAALGVTLRLFDVALIGASDVWQPALAVPRRGDDHRRQRRRARPVLAEADARVLVGRAGGLHAGGRRRRDPARRAGDGLLPRRLPRR